MFDTIKLFVAGLPVICTAHILEERTMRLEGFGKRTLFLLTVLGVFFVASTGLTRENCIQALRKYRAVCNSNHDLSTRCKILEEVVQLCPGRSLYHMELAKVLEKTAGERMGLLHERKKDSEDFLQAVAGLNEVLDRALSHYTKAEELGGADYESSVGRGRILFSQGRYEMAVEAFEAANKIKPGDRRCLGYLYAAKEAEKNAGGEFKTSDQILQHVLHAESTARKIKGMGVLSRTVVNPAVKDRLRFNNILFDEWSAEIKDTQSITQLDQIGKVLTSESGSHYHVIIEGHTDNRGGLERNRALSWDRANSVRNYLSKKFQVSPDRFTPQGFGFSRPRVANDSDENRRLNRRVEVLFLAE